MVIVLLLEPVRPMMPQQGHELVVLFANDERERSRPDFSERVCLRTVSLSVVCSSVTRNFQYESFFTISSPRKVHRSQPRISMRSPSVEVHDRVHSDAPRWPSKK